MKITVLVTALSFTGLAAQAADLVYTPVNPSFGGNPLNSTFLLSTASAQRSKTASDAVDPFSDIPDFGDPQNDTASLFIRQLEGRLLSALAGEVTEAIFGEAPQESGIVTFGTTTVSFDRSLEAITLTISDSLDGSLTEIIVPQLVSGG